MTRIKAFLIHLGISFFFFLVILYFIVFHWYPDFLFYDDGGQHWLGLIAGVAIVLGPFLTLLMFKPGKWGLKFDIWVIAILQALALAWLTWSTFKERPYVIVYADYSFRPLTQYQFQASKATPAIINKACTSKPCMIFSALPEGRNERNEVRLKALQTGTPIHLFGEYYKPFSPASIRDMENENINLAELLKTDKQKRKTSIEAQNKIVAYQKLNNQLMFLPISSRYKEQIAVFDTVSYSIVDTINYNVRSLR